jgi:hypothetical protein
MKLRTVHPTDSEIGMLPSIVASPSQHAAFRCSTGCLEALTADAGAFTFSLARGLPCVPSMCKS